MGKSVPVNPDVQARWEDSRGTSFSLEGTRPTVRIPGPTTVDAGLVGQVDEGSVPQVVRVGHEAMKRVATQVRKGPKRTVSLLVTTRSSHAPDVRSSRRSPRMTVALLSCTLTTYIPAGSNATSSTPKKTPL